MKNISALWGASLAKVSPVGTAFILNRTAHREAASASPQRRRDP